MKLLIDIIFNLVLLFIGYHIGSNFTEYKIYEDCQATEQHTFRYFGHYAYYACVHPSHIKGFVPKD